MFRNGFRVPWGPAVAIAPLLALGMLAVGAVAATGAAQPSNGSSGPELQQKLATPLRVSWQGTSLERALASLSEIQRMAIVRDRRIDPNRPLELVIEDQPLEKVLALIADHLQAGYCQLGPVAVIGPAGTTAKLRTLAAARLDEARALPASVREPFLLLRTWQWNALAEPRSLVAELAAEAGVEITGVERIPHDLWPATELPLLSWCDRLSLIAAQFDLTYRIGADGRRVELVDIPEQVQVERTYAGGKNPQALARRWQRELAGAVCEVVGGELRVRAPLEVHERIEQQLSGAPTRRPKVTRGKLVYQLTVEKVALDKLVDKIVRDQDLTIQWDREASTAAGVAVDQLVSVKIKNADLDELLAAVFNGTGLAFRRQGKTVTVRVAK